MRSSAPCSGERCGTRSATTGWSRSASCGWPPRAAARDRRADRSRCPVPPRSRGLGVSPSRRSPTCAGRCGAGVVGRRGGHRARRTAFARRTWMRSSGSPSHRREWRSSIRFFTADSVAGEPLRDPTRWDIVPACSSWARRRPNPVRTTGDAGHHRGRTTSRVHRRSRPAERGRPNATTSTDTSPIRLSTRNGPPAAWGPFDALEHQALTLPYLRPALDSLPFIQANRRIFFLETWLAAFLRGQTQDSALVVVRQYLVEHPRLPLDLRRKVLQHMDELERTVRIRERAR